MPSPAGEERTLRIAYTTCGLLAAIPLAWGALRGFPGGFLFLLPILAGVCVVLLAVESSLRSIRSRVEELERRPPPPGPSTGGPPPVPPRPIPRGYDPGAPGAR